MVTLLLVTRCRDAALSEVCVLLVCQFSSPDTTKTGSQEQLDRSNNEKVKLWL